MQSQIYAGAMSVPVISQSLGFLASHGLTIMNDENLDELVPDDAIVLAPCSASAQLPSRFLRKLPDSLAARKDELGRRRLEIPASFLEIPRLVLIKKNQRARDGSYFGDDWLRLQLALRDLAGIKTPKRKRHRATQKSLRHQRVGSTCYFD